VLFEAESYPHERISRCALPLAASTCIGGDAALTHLTISEANANPNGVPSGDVEFMTHSPQAQVLNGRIDDVDTIHQSVLADPADDSAAVSSQRPPTTPFENAPGAATSRWRTSAHRVIQMNRSTSHFLNVRVRRQATGLYFRRIHDI
jgi:hypothetical protein